MDAMTEMLNRLPLNLDKVIKEYQANSQKKQMDKSLPRHVGSREQATLMEMCLRCTTVVFDCMVYHFKSLRNFESFQSLWLKYITTLAQNAHMGASGSEMKCESVDMIGSLLRLLHRPPGGPSTSAVGSADASSHRGDASVPAVHTPGSLGDGTSTSSADRKKTEGEHKAVNDDTLMLVSWRAVKAGCPSLIALMQVNHPLIVETIIAMEAKQQQTVNDRKSAGSATAAAHSGGSNDGGSNHAAAAATDQRSLYSRLFESKSQIV
jgi:hypothetical protein